MPRSSFVDDRPELFPVRARHRWQRQARQLCYLMRWGPAIVSRHSADAVFGGSPPRVAICPTRVQARHGPSCLLLVEVVACNAGEKNFEKVCALDA